jgi:hypothetical protein
VRGRRPRRRPRGDEDGAARSPRHRSPARSAACPPGLGASVTSAARSSAYRLSPPVVTALHDEWPARRSPGSGPSSPRPEAHPDLRG